jgi:tetratricopeptide (TPR) repeat protein
MAAKSYILFPVVLIGLLFVSSVGLASGQTQSPHAGEVQEYSRQAALALRDNQPDAAAQAYGAILKIDPNNIDARANLGVVDLSQGKWEQAADEFRRVLKLQPSLWKAQALLGICEQNLGHTSESSRLFEASFPNLQDTRLRIKVGLELTEIWRQGDELQKASEVVGQMLELDSTNVDVLYAAYRVHASLAAQAIDALALSSPDSAQLHRALAEHQMNEGHLVGAIAEYKKALQSGVASAGLHYELGEALLLYSHMESSLAEAQKEFENALALDPGDAGSECKLGEIELSRSNSQTAQGHYAHALKLQPESVCAKLGLAGLLTDQGKSAEASGYLESAVRSAPYNSEAHHRLGVLYREMGRKEDADRELKAFEELHKVQSQLQQALQSGAASQ